jgi:hypothetical protein
MKLFVRPIALALLLVPGAARAFPVTVVQQTGPVTRRFNIAVLGDGYRPEDQAKLTSDAKTLVDDLFAAEPYSSYRGLFNVKVVQAVSQDRGAAGGRGGNSPNTAFSATFLCEGSEPTRLLCADDEAVLAAAARDVPEFNLAVVLSNDTTYGGSGGDVPCVSANPDSAEILRHELGHTIGDLADEYEDPYPGYGLCSRADDCREPNVTLRNVRADIKWLDWIAATTPVPTPEDGQIAGVGVFEGARYLSSGVYRPVESGCKMRELDEPFCPVCKEGLVRAFWNLPNTNLIDEVTPAGDVQTDTCTRAAFSITTPTIQPSTLRFSWTIDGQPRAGAKASFDVTPGLLPAGQHVVAVTVTDATPLVRSDPEGLLKEEHSWALTLAACDSEASAPIDSGGAGGVGEDGGTESDGPTAIDDAVAPPKDATTPTHVNDGGGGASGAPGRDASSVPRRDSSDVVGGCACRVTGAGRGDGAGRAALSSLLLAWAAVRRSRRARGPIARKLVT